jgi:hypothetical protein
MFLDRAAEEEEEEEDTKEGWGLSPPALRRGRRVPEQPGGQVWGWSMRGWVTVGPAVRSDRGGMFVQVVNSDRGWKFVPNGRLPARDQRLDPEVAAEERVRNCPTSKIAQHRDRPFAPAMSGRGASRADRVTIDPAPAAFRDRGRR